MRCFKTFLKIFLLLCAAFFIGAGASAEPAPAPEYHIYAGNTHSHTSNTWSHGDQWKKGGVRVVDGVSQPKTDSVLKPDWQKFQGTPATHFALARAEGYDFYAVTDHSQEAPLDPVGPDNPAWLAQKRDAAAATDAGFAAISGFEYSENNGPGVTGHINVYNSAEYLNALKPGMDMPYLYKWLVTAKPNGGGPVLACFNHPGKINSFDNWGDRTPALTDIFTMLEVINFNRYWTKDGLYHSFIRALDHGWKVSPVCGHDNHGTTGIKTMNARTFVLATAKTKTAILDAMQHRRTYAAYNKTIQCRYTVNGQVMGSTLAPDAGSAPEEFQFDILVTDPETANPGHAITKIDIVTDGGKVVQTHDVSPASHSVRWKPLIKDAASHYYFVRVWNASGGDIPDATPDHTVAWLAPVWTGR